MRWIRMWLPPAWRRVAIAVGAANIVALGVAVALVSSAAAQSGHTVAGTGSATYSDAVGDSGSAPDLTTVRVDGDPATGSLSVTVTALGYQPASSDGLYRNVAVWLDTDRNRATGDKDGTEFGVLAANDASGFRWGVARWDGGSWVRAVSPATSESRNGDTITWQFNVSDLGGRTSFDFYAYSFIAPSAGASSTARDQAPEGLAMWTYDIGAATSTTVATTTTAATTTAATTTTTASAPERTMTQVYWPTIGPPVAVPARLVAGARATVSFRVTRDGKPLKAGKMTCDPSVAGRVVSHTESFKNGVARLAFVVPKTAKGKSLRVKLTIKPPSYQGPDGVYVDAATGQSGTLHLSYQGMATTKVATFRVH